VQEYRQAYDEAARAIAPDQRQEGGRRKPSGPNVSAFLPPAPSLHPPSFPPPEPGLF
jgi:hypothetical protein